MTDERRQVFGLARHILPPTVYYPVRPAQRQTILRLAKALGPEALSKAKVALLTLTAQSAGDYLQDLQDEYLEALRGQGGA